MGVPKSKAFGIQSHINLQLLNCSKVYMTVYGIKNFYANQFACETLKQLNNVEFLTLGDFRVETYPFSLDLPLFKNLVELRFSLENRNSLYHS